MPSQLKNHNRIDEHAPIKRLKPTKKAEKPGVLARWFDPTTIGKLFTKPGQRTPPLGYLILVLDNTNQTAAELINGVKIHLDWNINCPTASEGKRYWCTYVEEPKLGRKPRFAQVLFAIVAPQKRPTKS